MPPDIDPPSCGGGQSDRTWAGWHRPRRRERAGQACGMIRPPEERLGVQPALEVARLDIKEPVRRCGASQGF
ncbi:MAG: hypothetical protein OXH76_11890 [Boseongicola sp.]|nr:hypothetical protein [Boseongicola sp.]